MASRRNSRTPNNRFASPVFKSGQSLNVESFYPVHKHPELSAAFTNGFFGLYKRTANQPVLFTFQEEESERYGIPLLDLGINAIPSSKIEIRDLDGDGLPDVIVGENNWGENYLESGKNGKNLPTN